MRVLGIRKPVWIAALVVLALIPVVLWFYQPRMIYVPSRYEAGEAEVELPRRVRLAFRTSQGQQLAFYIPPRDGSAPDTVWMFCVGNADRALSWENFASTQSDPRAGALLIDYPSYGACEGVPTPATILESTEAAVNALAVKLADPGVADRMAMYGHSLGSAAVLQYAAAHGARRIVLVAPFTTMMAMARRKVGWPLCLLLRHRFDNETNGRIVRERGIPVIVLHGTKDAVIPFPMGKRIAEISGATFYGVEGAGHVDITDCEEEAVRAFMIAAADPVKIAG